MPSSFSFGWFSLVEKMRSKIGVRFAVSLGRIVAREFVRNWIGNLPEIFVKELLLKFPEESRKERGSILKESPDAGNPSWWFHTAIAAKWSAFHSSDAVSGFVKFSCLYSKISAGELATAPATKTGSLNWMVRESLPCSCAVKMALVIFGGNFSFILTDIVVESVKRISAVFDFSESAVFCNAKFLSCGILKMSLFAADESHKISRAGIVIFSSSPFWFGK